MKTATAMLLAGILFISTVLLLPKHRQPTPSGLRSPLVRLIDPVTKHFTCSGVIVSDTRLMTAGHCLMHMDMMGVTVVGSYEVRTIDDKETGIVAKFEGAEPRSDQGMMSGDFRTFAKIRSTSYHH